MKCPRCHKDLDLEQHGELVFDDVVWCSGCHAYEARLLEVRPFGELQEWARRLCEAFGQEPVELLRDPDYLPDPGKYWNGRTFVLAEATYETRRIMLHPPGHTLKTLCHELAHLFSRREHDRYWAYMFAKLVAWVKARL